MTNAKSLWIEARVYYFSIFLGSGSPSHPWSVHNQHHAIYRPCEDSNIPRQDLSDLLTACNHSFFLKWDTCLSLGVQQQEGVGWNSVVSVPSQSLLSASDLKTRTDCIYAISCRWRTTLCINCYKASFCWQFVEQQKSCTCSVLHLTLADSAHHLTIFDVPGLWCCSWNLLRSGVFKPENFHKRVWIFSGMMQCPLKVTILCSHLQVVEGAGASWLVHPTNHMVCALMYWAVQVQVLTLFDIVLVFLWAGHLTLTVPLSTQVYKWVPANIMLRPYASHGAIRSNDDDDEYNARVNCAMD